MTVISEIARIERWIYTILSTDGTIAAAVNNRIYAGIAPQDATYPLITYTPLSPGEDVDGPGAVRIWSAPLYLIRVITTGGSIAAIQSIADRIEALFQGARGGISDATIQFCKRERGHRMTTMEPPGNTLYQFLGGEWRIAASPLVNP